MKKYIISLLKYIGIVIVFILFFTGLQLLLPSCKITLTYNQALLVLIISIIVIAIILKHLFSNKN